MHLYFFLPSNFPFESNQQITLVLIIHLTLSHTEITQRFISLYAHCKYPEIWLMPMVPSELESVITTLLINVNTEAYIALYHIVLNYFNEYISI